MAYKKIKKDDKSITYKIDTNDDFIALVAERAGFYSLRPEVLEFVLDHCRKISDCFKFAQKIVEYKKDSKAGEIILSPVEIIKRIKQGKRVAGDCDDKSLFLATLVAAMGYPVRLLGAHFITGKESKSEMNEINHIFVEFYDPKTKKWYYLEPSSKKLKPGQKSPKVLVLTKHPVAHLTSKEVSANVDDYKTYVVLRNTGKTLKAIGTTLENITPQNIDKIKTAMTLGEYARETLENPISVSLIIYSAILTIYLFLRRKK